MQREEENVSRLFLDIRGYFEISVFTGVDYILHS